MSLVNANINSDLHETCVHFMANHALLRTWLDTLNAIEMSISAKPVF